MATNYLEQLVAEWYEYQGYFIRRNVRVGKLPKGGYEGELDIVAFHPEKKHLVHIEPTHDAHTWAKREERFENKEVRPIRLSPHQGVLGKGREPQCFACDGPI